MFLVSILLSLPLLLLDAGGSDDAEGGEEEEAEGSRQPTQIMTNWNGVMYKLA
ncbi:hypothetical protein A2U01_0018785 [Trifolium medium]|uniref:Uncharacterized protein n=1 Tax=Trifolium medium TaxID=97028 RepID=A0A392NF02_9FABA|nr:hypothetical protein [Trifolium medium]